MDRPDARVVIDCDPGRDDALAILATLGNSALQLDFISTVAGNVPLNRGTRNALAVLAVAGVSSVPVYRGAAAPLKRQAAQGSALHGDLSSSHHRLPDSPQRPAGAAHEALRTWCRETGAGPKRLVAIGPLTNIARLLRDDREALAGVDDLFIMGGTVSGMSTRVSPTAEFNFHADPEAADLVLNSGARIWLYDYDTTANCQLPVSAIDRIGAGIGLPIGGFVAGWLRDLWIHANRPYGRAGIAVHDLYAAAGAAGIGPESWEWYEMRVDCGDSDRGTIRSQPSEPGRGIAVARGLDPALMEAFLVNSARNLSGIGAR